MSDMGTIMALALEVAAARTLCTSVPDLSITTQFHRLIVSIETGLYGFT